MSNDLFLAHYGVKGMKWGVRRQDSDGDGRIDSSMKSQSASLGDKDRTVPAGFKILNVSDRKYKPGVSERLYSSYTKADKNEYTSLFDMMGDSGSVYHHTFQTKKNIKLPSDKKAADIFFEMAKQDPKGVSNDMAKAYKARVGLPLKSAKSFEKKISSLDSLTKEKGEKLYKQYNHMLANDMASSKNFYARLSKEGYGAISDLHDRGKFSQDPLIFIHPDKNLKPVESVRLTKKDVASYTDYVYSKKHKKDQRDYSEVGKFKS